MDNYDPNKNYTFTDKDGNTFTSKGDNGYVWQSITEGTPISVNSKGEWYIEPYIESDGRSVTVHMPEWFKGTNEYAEWNDKYSYLLSSMDLTNDNISQMNDLLKGYGSQGAFRLTSKNELAKYNITDPNIQDKAFNDLLQIQAEANNIRDAQLIDIFGSDEAESVAKIARDFQGMSKEDLSRTMTKMYTILKNHSTATNVTPESQKQAADAYTLVKLLNMVDDNPTLFGKDKEFEGLLQASGLQKFNAMVNSDVDVLTQGIAAVPARLLYGILNAFAGKGFDANLTSGTDWGTDPSVGANLEGTEGWIQAGSVMGLTTNIAETIGVSILLGGAVSNLGMTMAAGSGGAIAAIGSFMQTVPGSMVTDFILHDTPIDLLQFLTDASAYDWDWGKAWNNPEQKQNFIGIPVVGDIISAQFGKVDAGLKNNLFGDAVVDLSIPIISIGKGAISDGFDQATHGAYTRLKDNIALSNMKVQNWLADIPVLGDGWKRFVNHMMGAENAQFIREARRQAVDDWSIDIYRDAHNKLTLKNHYGAEAVGPMFESILKKYDIPTTVKNFQVESVKYGGMGETVIKWKEIDKKTLKTVVKSKTVPDLLPKQVKQGLLDIERLGELKGQAGALGGIITDVSSEKEIAELEKRVAQLPEEIKAFGDKMIAANKDLEKVGVLLGISNEEWVDALQADEKWAKYMTRQSIVPGYGMEGVTGSSKPLNAKQLTESRKGYYDAEKYLDPYLAMNMKAVALGKAYAWNEQAKMVVSMQISKGSVIAGKASPEIAKRLAEVKAEIKSIGEYRTKLGYDETITRVTKDTDTISNVFREINSTLELPRQLSLKSVYVNNTTPQNIKNLTDNFNGGQIKFADDVRENVGLDEGSAAAVIRNTYKFDGTGDVKHAEVKTNIVEEPPITPKVETPEVPETPKVETPEVPKVETPETPKVETPETPKSGGMPTEVGILKKQAAKLDDEIAKRTDDLKAKMNKKLGKIDEKTLTNNLEKALGHYSDVKIEDYFVRTKDGFALRDDLNALDIRIASQICGYGGVGEEVYGLVTKRQTLQAQIDYPPETPTARQDLPRISEERAKAITNAEKALQENLENNLWFDSEMEPLIEKGLVKKIDDDGDPIYVVKDNPTLEELEEIYEYQLKYADVDDIEDGKFQQVDFEAIRNMNPNQLNLLGEQSTTIRGSNYPGFNVTDDGNAGYLRMLDETNPKATREGTLREYNRTYKGRDVAVLEMDPAEYNKILNRARAGWGDARSGEKVAEYVKKFQAGEEASLPTLSFDNDGKLVGQEGRHRTAAASEAGIEKVPVVVEYSAKAGLPKSLQKYTDVTEDFVKRAEAPTDSMEGAKTNVGYGMTDRGVPYRFEMQGDTITKIDRVTDYEEIAESVNGLTGTYNISTDTVSKMGEEFTFAINRAVLFYKNNFPVLETKSSFSLVTLEDTTYAQCVGWTSLSVDDSGHLVSKDTPVQFNHKFFDAGKENSTLQSIRNDVIQTYHPKNTTDLSNVATHESGHAMTWKLTVAEINRLVDEGKLDLKGMSYGELADLFYEKRTKMQEEVIFAALEKLGIKNDRNHVNLNKARHTISRYATAPNKSYATKNSETIAEAFTDYAFNNSNSSKFTLAIMDEFKKRLARFAQAGSPNLVMKENGLDIPAKMFDGNEYAFPTNVKSGDQKSEWLNKWRQKNPYLKGEMTEETYKKANLWDTFFEKEAKAYSANAKTEAPEVLIKKNADFLDSYSKSAAERMINQIKAASVDGFDTNIATLALSHNGADTAKALNEFIIGRIDRAANEIAAKMEGGATMDNIIKAKFTLWDDLNIKNSMKNMAQTLIPDVSNGQVAEQIDNLFDTQLKGMGTLEALPVDAKELIALRNELSEKLFKENNYAKKVGKKADQALSDYRGEVSQVIRYREGGEDVYVVVNDPVVAEILKKPNDFKNTGTTVETIAQVSNFIARTYRLGTTGANPVAFITNVLRDPVQAVYQGGWNPVNMVLSPEAYYRTLRHYGLDDATITEVTQKIQTWAKSGTMTQEIRNMGGDTPGSIGYRTKSEKFAKDFNKAMTGNKLVEVGEMPLEGWEKMFRNQIGMQSFEKNYRRTRDVNKALSAAMFDTSNATTNFSHAVGIFKRATSTVPYLSSAINGTASFWRMFNIDPLGMIMRIGGGFVIPALALTAWNLSSEERRKAYLNLPEWYRQGHITLVGEDGDIYALPIPDELEQFYGTARKLMEFTNDATPYAIPTILAQGMFGFLPVEVDGFFADDGSINLGRGFAQLGSGLIPQAVTMAYELWAEQDLYTGQDLSNYEWYNKTLNALTNVFGTGFASAINSIGMMCGASEKLLVGKSYADTLARNLFGLGFDSATQQFMEMIGKETTVDANGKETKATGLFAENEKLQNQIATINKQMAYASDSEKEELRKQKQELIEKFTTRVKNLTENYMNLFHQTGGLETWKKKKIVSLLNLGKYVSSGEEGSYQMYDTEGAALDEYALARQRYVQAGLPAGPDMSSLVTNNNGNLTNSLELQAAVDKFYGVNKQAGADFKTALETSGLKNVKNEFYDAMQQIYDAADEQGKSPDYDLIEKIQARYLQMFDATLIPIINKYGISVLNDNDFINELRTYVNGMIPSDDWRQSVRNAKKFLSTKDFPTAGVDVKKWLTQRYSSGMRNRNLNSDPEVVNRMMDIKNDLDAGRRGAAKGKIESLKKGIDKANYYISGTDLKILSDYYNMVK